ncbi:MAG: hypothetical protein Ct9H300mP15_11600 [Gemmatimonadota bacterium]|nr:MAG: hypothetical protein Ct9H300mP15_11600 [Gemmatimonadota bacterium]
MKLFVRLRHQAEALRAELAAHEGAFRTSRPPRKGIQAATERSSWEGAVEECLAIIRGGAVSKVVLARTLDLDLGAPQDLIDTVEVVEHLWDANRGSHVFMFEPEPGSAIVGAAPETIATLQDGVFHATAVAGSIRRGSTPLEQAELATRLLASDKDRVEQRIALDDMLRRLETVAQQIRTDPQPHVLTLARSSILRLKSVPAFLPKLGSSTCFDYSIRLRRSAVYHAKQRWHCWQMRNLLIAAGMPVLWVGLIQRATGFLPLH